ncbi:hypothetical protein [Clostridium thailandense]|uniref:hypothetical protein n=1 Tax=Clostridium thailandense TaxID=2794346 RepID=UPI0039894286
MDHILRGFAREYDLKVDKTIYSSDAQRSANNPVLFVFIGDRVKEASEHIRNTIREKWDNGDGVCFVNIMTEGYEDIDNYFNFKFNYELVDNKCLRKSIRDKFYNDKELLQNLNDKITITRDRILSHGSLFNSFEKINISVVTMADDPLNIILPEITILIKKRMLEVFKLGAADLYVLIKEKNIGDEFFSKASSVSFFREIEYAQKESFVFNEKIAIYGEGRELTVDYKGPVFYMTYLLEEKNERGIIPAASMKNNYEIISYINLLKNRNVSVETYSDTENQYYDNGRFKSSIGAEDSINRYITAGLSKVRRPNGAIAVTVMRAFYENVIGRLKEFSIKDKEFIAETLKIDEGNINLKVETILDTDITLMDMNGIMMSNTSSVEKRLSQITLSQIEESLYEDRCQNFFDQNFVRIAEDNLRNMNLEKEMRNLIKENILNNHKLGLYCAWRWTTEEGAGIEYIRNKRDLLSRHIENMTREIEGLYQSRLTEGIGFKGIFNRGGKLKDARKKIFLELYGKKFEKLKLIITEKVLEKYENVLFKINRELFEKIDHINLISEDIKEYENEIIKYQDEYTAQNVKVYYTSVVKRIVDKLEKKHGEVFYFEEKYIGNLSQNLEKGKEQLLAKIAQFCSSYILTEQEFDRSFEDEFNERANVNVEDLNTKVLSKEELYRRLYDILDDNSALKSYLMNYDVKGYQEKYFFGDYSSEFIKYAFDFDRKTRNYKIGYIHERRNSGIEKLNLMGGFGAKDVIYVRTALDFYNYCIENEYKLHGIDESHLPEII